MPKVSIIVPVFNAEKYLRQAIDSVIEQTFEDWELILVDDGSTDSSNAICKEYVQRDKRIRLIEKPNGGVSNARNAGLDNAQGEWIFFLDADDEMIPSTLALLTDIQSKSDAELVIGKMLYLCKKPDIYNKKNSPFKLMASDQLCRNILYQKIHTDNGPWAKLYKKSLFNGLRFYDGWFEDLEIFHKILFRANKIAVTDAVVYFYRKHPESFINSWSEGRKEIVSVTADIIKQMKASHPHLVKAAEHRHFSASFNLLVALIRHNPTDTENIKKNFAEIKALRKQIIFDPHSRLKNRMGAIASYSGLNFLTKAIKWVTK